MTEDEKKRKRREWRAKKRAEDPDYFKRYQRAAYAKDPKRYVGYQKKFYRENADKIRAYARARHKKLQPKQDPEYKRWWRQENRAEIQRKWLAWSRKNREKINAVKRDWYRRNPDKSYASMRRHREKKYLDRQWLEMQTLAASLIK